jgi:hypothetical protein
VITEFYELLAERLPPDAQTAGTRGLADRDAARTLLEAIWDLIAEIGAGGLILTASLRSSTTGSRSYRRASRRAGSRGCASATSARSGRRSS